LSENITFSYLREDMFPENNNTTIDNDEVCQKYYQELFDKMDLDNNNIPETSQLVQDIIT